MEISYEKTKYEGQEAIVVSGLGCYSLKDTLECGQCFRHERIENRCTEGYEEYFTVAGDVIVRVGQRERGELLFYDIDEALLPRLSHYFALDRDLFEICREIMHLTDSPHLLRAAELAAGIAILRQDAWEALFSFIISQNNNIPRIKKIVREICGAYGVNLALQNPRLHRTPCDINANCKPEEAGGILGYETLICPLGKGACTEQGCRACGRCFSFPGACEVLSEPEKLLISKPGFRYGYLLDAAKKCAEGEIDLDEIRSRACYDYTREQLKRIKGVGDKVAACVALFGFENLDAFPIDVWMRRAIDTYFDGHLDYEGLGRYRGIAQQYIFHYIRNIESKTD